MLHLISESVRLRFILNIVTSRHVTRAVESFIRFAESGDPNSQSLHTSVDTRRVATRHPPSVANPQNCLYSEGFEQRLSAFSHVFKDDIEREVTLRLTVSQSL